MPSVLDDSSPVALVLVDHGSREPDANAVLDALAALVAHAAGDAFVAVEPAHMEIAEPSLGQAFERCVRKGAARVAVVPVFVASGRHLREDIPRLSEQAARSHPGLQWLICPPLGADPKVAKLLLDRGLAAAAAQGWRRA